jgi:GR25 family glycosyltransferase involved in LPS biosynthesis
MNQFFDRIIYLNSSKRLDRLANMQKRLSVFDNVERFEALTGGTPKALELFKKDGLYLQEAGTTRGRRKLNNGEIGCYLSHREIWKYIKKQGWNKVLILEDDAKLVEPFEFDASELPDNWDMLYFGQYCYDHDFLVRSDTGKNAALIEHIDKNLFKASHCWLTHAYAVNVKCIDYLLDNTKLLDWPIDGILAGIQDNLNVYAFYPNIIVQDDTKSSLR